MEDIIWEIELGSAKFDTICRVVREDLFDKSALKKSGACEGGRLWDLRGKSVSSKEASAKVQR